MYGIVMKKMFWKGNKTIRIRERADPRKARLKARFSPALSPIYPPTREPKIPTIGPRL